MGSRTEMGLKIKRAVPGYTGHIHTTRPKYSSNPVGPPRAPAWRTRQLPYSRKEEGGRALINQHLTNNGVHHRRRPRLRLRLEEASERADK